MARNSVENDLSPERRETLLESRDSSSTILQASNCSGIGEETGEDDRTDLTCSSSCSAARGGDTENRTETAKGDVHPLESDEDNDAFDATQPEAEGEDDEEEEDFDLTQPVSALVAPVVVAESLGTGE